MMSSDHHPQQQECRPTISHPLTRHRSHGHPPVEISHLRSSPPRPTSPPPRGYRTKPSIFALMRRSGGTLDSIPSAYEEEAGVEMRKPKGKGKDRWSKRASRKAPPPPPRERGESEELDWERIKTLPRVRLVPPEDEGDPVMLYPIPHPSSLIPLRPRPQSPPSLLSATIAATLINTDPSAFSSPPPSPTRHTSPPSGVVLNSLAHATSISQQHGHWIGMSDKFILPPPVFSRGPATSGRPAAARGIIMPKTRRQLEADIGKRMSMVEQRKRDSLELERFSLLPPLEEAAQSPPNVMMPPLEEGYADHGEVMRMLDEDEDLPLAVVRNRSRPSSPPNGRMFDSMMTIHSVAPFDIELSKPSTPAELAILGPAIELKPASSRKGSRDQAPFITSPPPLVVHIQSPPVVVRPKPPPPPPQPVMEQPPPPITRPKRSKSLTAVLSRSSSDDGPSTSNPPPPVPTLKRQKSLKALFFPSSDPAPPIPTIKDLLPSPRDTKRASRDFRHDVPEASTSKRTRLSRAKSKPSLRIEVSPHSQHVEACSNTPALATASSSGYSEAYPLTPGTAKSVPVRDENSAPVKGVQSAGGIRGLSKRFSLSNMSGAFRKKSSISGMIPMPTEVEVPVVPELPAAYRGSGHRVKGKDKGKRKEVPEVAPIAAMEVQRRSQSLDTARLSLKMNEHQDVTGEDDWEGEETYGEPTAGPSRVSTDLGHNGGSIPNLIGLSSLGTEPFDIIDSDFEFPPTSSSPIPSSEEGCHSNYYSNSVQPTPTQDPRDNVEPTAILNRFPDPETDSLSSGGSLDDDEQPSIVHAQLMHVSPTTRRNPGVSMQEFLGSAPLPQTGVLVASPQEKRRSVEGIIIGPPLLGLESPLQVLMKEVKEAKSLKEAEKVKILQEAENAAKEVKAEAEISEGKRERKRRSHAERPMSMAPPTIDLRGQYLKGIGPSGSRGAQQLLGRSNGPSTPISPISPASSATCRASEPSVPAPVILPPMSHSLSDDKDDTQSEVSSSEGEERIPETPLLEDQDQHLPTGQVLDEPAIHDAEQNGNSSQYSSVDSGLVIVEAPLMPSPPPLQPADIPTRHTSRASTPRSRFTTPEALLRLLTSPLAASRLSRSHPTPGSNGSSKGKKGVAPSTMPIPVELEGLPIPRQADGEVNWSALLVGTQLGSLHFDDLGLDLKFGDEQEAVAVAV